MAEALATAMPAIWDWDAATGIFSASDAYRELHGFAAGAPVTLEAIAAACLEEDGGWAQALLTGEPSSLPDTVRYRIRRHGEVRWIRSRLTVARDSASGRIVAITGIADDVTEVEQATQSLSESEQRLRLAIEAGRMAVWEVELISGKLTPSPELNTLLGLSPEARPTLWDVRQLYAPGEIERLNREGVTLEAVRNRSSQGDYSARDETTVASDDRTQIQAEFSLITPAGVQKRLLLRAQYAPRPRGNPMVTGVLVDVTEQARSRDRLAVVARELQHRIKNTIAVVRALATQTLRSHDDPKVGLESYTARLQALALATDSIFAEDSGKTDLLSLASRMTGPYLNPDKTNLVVEGEPIQLSAKQASAIGMVLHEFSTNALKYGALSVPDGTVMLNWRRRDADDWIEIKWEESGGPPVHAPKRLGFGSRLVSAMVTGDLGGVFEPRYAEAGFQARIGIPVEGEVKAALG